VTLPVPVVTSAEWSMGWGHSSETWGIDPNGGDMPGEDYPYISEKHGLDLTLFGQMYDVEFEEVDDGTEESDVTDDVPADDIDDVAASVEQLADDAQQLSERLRDLRE